MHSPSPTPRSYSRHRLALFSVGFALVVMAALGRSQTPPQANKSADALKLARNPERLHLLLDPSRVFGWISGIKNHAGETVAVTSDGRTQKIAVGRGNTFLWPHKVTKATRVEFAIAGLAKTLEVQPPSPLPPCVFFVVDRGVYRPKQTLRFAAFLRDLDARGEFTPRPAQTVEVLLTGVQKKTIAARLKLIADAHGRINGEYTFSDADPLDDYRLSIPDYRGAAASRLANLTTPWAWRVCARAAECGTDRAGFHGGKIYAGSTAVFGSARVCLRVGQGHPRPGDRKTQCQPYAAASTQLRAAEKRNLRFIFQG